MNLLLVAATPAEIAPLEAHLQQTGKAVDAATFERGALRVTLLLTGVGLTATAFSLGRVLALRSFDLVINAGICGALDPSLAIGEVVHVTSETFGDLGVEEADGSFTDAFALWPDTANLPPFRHGVLHNDAGAAYDFLPRVAGVSVNKAHGSAASIAALRARAHAQVESMEGAAVFYACLLSGVPFLEIRAVSNYVVPRNRDQWNIPLAVAQLNQTLLELLEPLSG